MMSSGPLLVESGMAGTAPGRAGGGSLTAGGPALRLTGAFAACGNQRRKHQEADPDARYQSVYLPRKFMMRADRKLPQNPAAIGKTPNSQLRRIVRHLAPTYYLLDRQAWAAIAQNNGSVASEVVASRQHSGGTWQCPARQRWLCWPSRLDMEVAATRALRGCGAGGSVS